MAEIYAICNWKISPFNDDLNNGVADKKDYAFLIIPADNTTKVLDTRNIKTYIICSCRIEDIESTSPKRMIIQIDEDGKEHKMLFSSITVKNITRLKVVSAIIQDKKYKFKKVETATPLELSSLAGIQAWAVKTSTDLAEVNITVSRDPRSCND